jgi:acyl-coenzyme A synthetase/AMP-(fatty) acid ligase
LDPDRTALVWEKDEPGQEERMSYSQLLDLVGRLANLLRQVHQKQIRNKMSTVKVFYCCQRSDMQKLIRPKSVF